MQTDLLEYSKKVDESHRKDYGQFFTHPIAARFMVDWILQSQRETIYDPAFGLGAFLDPVLHASKIRFAASEIDPGILGFWRQRANGRQVEIANEDYLLSWGKSLTNIVCNPPYMRFQKFLNRDAVFKAFTDNLSLKLSGYTNTASAFLLKSLSELDGSGRLAYIMPLEFLNTGYGSIVKRQLIENGHLVAIVSLDCEREIFPDATTSVGIILYDSTRHHPHVDFHVVATVDSLPHVLATPPVARVGLDRLEPKSKWLSYFQPKTFTVNAQQLIPLNHYGRFSRGIATGANEFFVLKPSRAKELGLSPREVLPCITRSSQIRQPVFRDKDYDNLAKRDTAVLLFSPGRPYSKDAKTYIRRGEKDCYNARFLTKTRKPWFKTERRCPAPLLLGVFSRGGYKIVRNRSHALNLTCFHGFQPNIFGEQYIDRLFLYLASSSGRDIVLLSKRRYGDALDKFEPNDLNNALVPNPRILDELSGKDVKEAISYAEETWKMPSWVDGFFNRLKTEV